MCCGAIWLCCETSQPSAIKLLFVKQETLPIKPSCIWDPEEVGHV